jgi:hypothetical protein
MDEKIEEKTLQQLFEERDKSYHLLTEEIVGRIDFVFEAIIEVLELNPTAVSWEGVDIHGVMLVLVGKIGPLPSAPEKLRVITIGIPLPVVYSKSKDFVVKFLQTHAKEEINHDETDEHPTSPVKDISASRSVPTKQSGESKIEYEQRNSTTKRTLH